MSTITQPEPLVTVNILSFNRKDDLRVTLIKVFEQDYKNIEVIVVDNASTDGTVEMVKSEFPSVQFIEMNNNVGIAGWNEGFKAAQGDYVLVLDDDSYPNRESIELAVEMLEREPIFGIVAMEVWNNGKGISQTEYLRGDYCRTFIGCGAIIRKKIFENTGYYEPLLFLYAHEDEFSMRVIDNGYLIKYMPNTKVIHESSQTHRQVIALKNIDRRKVYYSTRNLLTILLLHFSYNKFVFRIVRIIVGRIFAGFKYGLGKVVLKSILHWVILIPKIVSNRKVLNNHTQKIYDYGSFAGGFYFSDGNFSLFTPPIVNRIKGMWSSK
jgi:hypothetical protein